MRRWTCWPSGSVPSVSAAATSSGWPAAWPRWARPDSTRPAGGGGAQARRRREARQGADLRIRRRRLVAERPVEPRLQQGPVLHRRARAMGRPHEVRRRLPARPLRGREGRVERRRLGVDVHHPQGLEVVGRHAVHRARTSSGRGSARWIRPPQNPYRATSLRHQGRRAVQQEARSPDASGVGVRGQGRLDAGGHAGGAARLLPGALRLPGRAARPPAVPSRSTATSGRRPPTSSATAPSRSRRGSTTRQWCSARTRISIGAKDVHARQGHHPDHPGAVGRPAVREQRARRDSPLQTGDLKRLQHRSPDAVQGRLPVPVPGHLVPHAPGDEAAVRQREGAAGGGPRDRPRERGEGGRWLRHPRPLHDSPRLPGRRSTTRRSGTSSASTPRRRWRCSRARRTRAAATGRRSP